MKALAAVILALSLLAPANGDAQTCPLPDATITIPGSASDGYVCSGQSFTAEVPDAGPGATYDWSVTATVDSITAGQGTRSITIVTHEITYGANSHAVRVTVTNSCGTSQGERSFETVTVNDIYQVIVNPPGLPTGVGPVGCANRGYVASVSPLPGSLAPPERTYQWQIDNGTITSGQGTSSIAFQAGSPGTLRWSVIGQDRCSSLGLYKTHSGSFLVVQAVSPAPTIVAPDSVAPGSTGNEANLNNWQELFTVGPRVSNFFWSLSNATTPDIPPIALPLVFTAGTSGNVTITATITDYCGHTYTPSVTVPISSQQHFITTDDQVCGDAQTQASAPYVAGATYIWNITNGMIVAGQGTPAITFAATGTSNVLLSVSINGASITKPVTVSASPDPTIATDGPVTPHVVRNASVADAGPGARYDWSSANATILGSADGREISYVAGDSGDMRLDTVVTTAAGCSAAGSMTLSIQCPKAEAAPAALAIGYVGSASGCSESNGRPCARGETIRFHVSSGAVAVTDCGTSVHWRFGAQSAAGASPERQFGVAGVYPVTVEVSNGLGSASAHVLVPVGSERRRATGH